VTDPLSIVTLGAAVGGVAGKFAEKAWAAAERWLSIRFAEHTEAAKAQAHANAAEFLIDLANRVSELERNGRIDKEGVTGQQQHPQFTATLQCAILRAAQTDDRDKHSLLARLISERLAARSESIIALASQMACDAIALSTQRQLKLLALCSFLEEIHPKNPVYDARRWLEIQLEPLTGLDWFYEVDALHLVALSCVSFDPKTDKSLFAHLFLKIGLKNQDAEFREDVFSGSTNIDWLQGLWTEGLAGVQLTSVGSLVGALAYDSIRGTNTGPAPRWNS
jgi:hypothetical protein